MGLVDEDVIDAQLVEHQPVVLLVLGEQVLQPLLAAAFCFSMVLMRLRLAPVVAGVLAEQLVVFGDLLAEEPLLVVAATCRSARSCYGSR